MVVNSLKRWVLSEVGLNLLRTKWHPVPFTVNWISTMNAF